MGTSRRRYAAVFKVEAVREATEKGRAVREAAERLGVSAWSLYEWVRTYRKTGAPVDAAAQDAAAEIRRLKAELRRVTEERDILNNATAYFAKQSG